MKASKGLWTIKLIRSSAYIYDGEDHLVGVLPYVTEQQKANAHLMAASPLLLEAAKAVAKFMVVKDDCLGMHLEEAISSAEKEAA